MIMENQFHVNNLELIMRKYNKYSYSNIDIIYLSISHRLISFARIYIIHDSINSSSKKDWVGRELINLCMRIL